MTDSLKTQFRAVVPLTEPELDEVTAYFVPQRVKRNALIVRVGRYAGTFFS